MLLCHTNDTSIIFFKISNNINYNFKYRMTQSDIVLVNLSNMGIRQVNQHVFPFSVMPWLKKGS